MANSTTSTIDTFKNVLIGELRALEERRRADPPTPGPTRDEIVKSIETELRKAGLQPWQLYLSILADTGAASGFRRTAVNLLHIPVRVPEDAAQQIGDVVVAVMQEQGLDYNLAQQTVMAASILREGASITQMLPISSADVDSYFIPFVEQVPTRGPDQSQSEANLGHVAHMLASIARFTVVHNHAYGGLLSLKLKDFYEAQAEFKDELEKAGKLHEKRRGLPRGFYAIVHPMEHLAELMDEGAKTRDRSLVELLVRERVVHKFASLLEQRAVLGIAGGDIPRYLLQSDGFLTAVKEIGMKL